MSGIFLLIDLACRPVQPMQSQIGAFVVSVFTVVFVGVDIIVMCRVLLSNCWSFVEKTSMQQSMKPK